MGNLKGLIGTVIAGVLVLVIGLVLASTILNQAATAGSATNIGSFSGAQDLNDLVPLIYYTVIVTLGVVLIGIGGVGMARRSGGI